MISAVATYQGTKIRSRGKVYGASPVLWHDQDMVFVKMAVPNRPASKSLCPRLFRILSDARTETTEICRHLDLESCTMTYPLMTPPRGGRRRPVVCMGINGCCFGQSWVAPAQGDDGAADIRFSKFYPASWLMMQTAACVSSEAAICVGWDLSTSLISAASLIRRWSVMRGRF